MHAHRRFILAGLLAGAVLWAAPGGAQTPWEQRRQPVEQRKPLWLDGAGQPKPFEVYVRDAQEAIGRYHTQPKGPALAEPLAQAIGPRMWPEAGRDCSSANTDGLLLIHGLSDSPYLMRDLGDKLAEQPLAPGRCVRVRSLLLPGHATVPGELLDVQYTEWVAAVRYGIGSFSGVAGRVHLVGFSTGGALSLHAAYQPRAGQPALASLVLLAPALQARALLGRSAPLLAFLHWSGWKRWVDQHEDLDAAKYESFPVNAARQLAELGQELKPRLAQSVPVPVFMAVPLNDDTIDTQASLELFQHQADARSRLWIAGPRGGETDLPVALRGDPRVRYVAPGAADPPVRDFSHTSLPVRPDNAHYGKTAPYVNCLHYARRPALFCACITPRMREAGQCPAVEPAQTFYGEMVEDEGPDHAPLLRRLTFNPQFDDLVRAMRDFLATVAAP